MLRQRVLAALVCLLPLPLWSASILNSALPGISNLNVSLYTSGLTLPQGMQQLPDGSLLIQSSPDFSFGALQRFTSTVQNGVADGPGTTVFSTPSLPPTQLRTAGKYILQGNYGDGSISFLQPGATPSAPMADVATLQFTYPRNWEHNSIGIATRPTPGSPGSWDVVFNVGSQFDAAASTSQAGLSGLTSGLLDGDSLYVITVDETGSVPVAGNPRKVASGIRNVFGMAFQPGTGNFYFSDNAEDGSPDPPQADELNMISAADFGITVPDFGYPNCYIQYITSTPQGTGCVQPIVAFQPIPTTIDGMKSQGATEIAFAPLSFPTGFNNGIFIGFSGTNEQTRNPVIYFDLGTGQYVDFIGQSTLAHPLGLLATSDALFISDWGTGNVYAITAAAPEPGSGLLAGLALGAILWRRRSAAVLSTKPRT